MPTCPRVLRRPSFLLASVLLALLAHADEPREEGHAAIFERIQFEKHMDAWQRYPILALPLLPAELAPTIDGIVDAREWAPASSTSHTLLQGSAELATEPFRLYLLYTPDAFYIAFQSTRPPKGPPPGPRDMFEMIFDIQHEHGRYLNAAFTLEGKRFDGEGPALRRDAWSPNWQYKARTTAFGWEGEIRLDFADVPGGCPVPGTAWGADFARNESTPSDRIAIWGWRGDWQRSRDFGHIVFSGIPVAYRIEDIGWLPDRQSMGVRCRIVNAGDTPLALSWQGEIWRVNGDQPLNFIRAVDSALTEDLSAAISSTAEAEIASALESNKRELMEAADLTIPPQQNRLLTLLAKDQPGSYLATVQVMDPSAKEKPARVCGLAVPFDVSQPLAFKLSSYVYSAELLEVSVDLRRIDLGDQPAELRVAVLNVNDDQELAFAERTVATAEDSPVFSLPLRPDPAGMNLRVIAELRRDGTAFATNSTPFVLPAKPDWIRNSVGRSAMVPPPWTPVEASDTHTRTLKVRYDWDGKTILPAITVNTHEPLAAPIDWRFMTATGETSTPRVTAFELAEKTDEFARYRFRAELPGIGTLSGTATVEFDGLLWYEMDLVAEDGMQQAVLHVPMKPQHARIMTTGRTPAHFVGKESIPRFDFVGRFKAVEFPFNYHVFLGDFDAGLQWFCERPKDWVLANPLRAIRTTQSADAHTLDVTFVDSPVAAGRTLHWAFGFSPTPSRDNSMGYDQGVFHQVNGIPDLRPLDEATADEAEIAQRQARIDGYSRIGEHGIHALILFGWWNEAWGYPGIDNAEQEEQLRVLVQTMHAQGVKVLIFAGWGMSTKAPEWRQWQSELVQLPLKNCGWGSYWPHPTTLHPDLFLFRLKETIERFGIDGIYMDSTTAIELSLNHAIRWQDDDGHERGGYSLLAMRDFTKRIYKTLHGEVISHGIYYNHHSPQANVMVENFTDVRCPSEFAQQYDGPLSPEFIDYFAAKNGAIQFGYYGELTNKNWMQRIKKDLIHLMPITVPMGLGFKCNATTFRKYTPRDSYEDKSQPMIAVGKAKRWIDTTTSEYLPWWRNADYLTVAPEVDTISALWLQRERREALMCLSNLENKERQLTATLNLDKIGFSPTKATDAITGTEYPVVDGQVTVTILGERFALMRLTE